MTTDLTPDALAELWRLLNAATPGPWMVDDEGDGVAVIVDEGDEFTSVQIAADLHQGDDGLTDARLIAAAVNALPALLNAAAERDLLAIAHRGALKMSRERAEERDALRAERDALAAKVERVRDWLDHRGVDASDRDGDYVDGYRAAQRRAVIDAAELRAALDEGAAARKLGFKGQL